MDGSFCQLSLSVFDFFQQNAPSDHTAGLLLCKTNIRAGSLACFPSRSYWLKYCATLAECLGPGRPTRLGEDPEKPDRLRSLLANHGGTAGTEPGATRQKRQTTTPAVQ